MTKKRTITNTNNFNIADELAVASRRQNVSCTKLRDLIKAAFDEKDKERDAYREICVKILELHFKKQDTETLEGLPSSLTIPRKEWAYKLVDSLVQGLLSDKRNTLQKMLLKSWGSE